MIAKTPPDPSQNETTPEDAPREFDPRMLEALICPQTRQTLAYDAQRDRLISRSARLAFPIRDGIPIMLIDEAEEIE